MGWLQSRQKGIKHSVDMSLVEERPEFASRFDPEECEEWPPLIFPVGEGMSDRVVQVVMMHQDRVVHFAVMQQHLHDGAWVEVARMDTCHGESHVHRFQCDGSEEKRQVFCVLNTIEDVESEFERACSLLVDEWETELRRWNR